MGTIHLWIRFLVLLFSFSFANTFRSFSEEGFKLPDEKVNKNLLLLGEKSAMIASCFGWHPEVCIKGEDVEDFIMFLDTGMCISRNDSQEIKDLVLESSTMTEKSLKEDSVQSSKVKFKVKNGCDFKIIMIDKEMERNTNMMNLVGTRPGKGLINLQLLYENHTATVRQEIVVMEKMDVTNNIIGYILLGVQELNLFLIGLRISFTKVKAILKCPSGVIIGVCCRTILCPCFGLSLMLLFSLEYHACLSVLLIGLMPTDPLTPIFTLLLQGCVELSMLILIVDSLLSTGTFFLGLYLLKTFMDFPSDEIHHPYIYPLGSMCAAIVPILLGGLLQFCTKKLSDAGILILDKIIQSLGGLFLLMIFTQKVSMFWYSWYLFVWMDMAAVILIPMAAIVCSGIISAVCQQKLTDIKSITIATFIPYTVLVKAILQMSFSVHSSSLSHIILIALDFATAVLELFFYISHVILMNSWSWYMKQHNDLKVKGLGAMLCSLGELIARSMIKAGEISLRAGHTCSGKGRGCTSVSSVDEALYQSISEFGDSSLHPARFGLSTLNAQLAKRYGLSLDSLRRAESLPPVTPLSMTEGRSVSRNSELINYEMFPQKPKEIQNRLEDTADIVRVLQSIEILPETTQAQIQMRRENSKGSLNAQSEVTSFEEGSCNSEDPSLADSISSNTQRSMSSGALNDDVGASDNDPDYAKVVKVREEEI